MLFFGLVFGHYSCPCSLAFDFVARFLWLVRDNVMCVLRRCPCRVCSLFLFVVIETGLCDWYRSLWWCVLWCSSSRLWVCFLFLLLIIELVLCSWCCSLVLSFGLYHCPCSLFSDSGSWTCVVWPLISLFVLILCVLLFVHVICDWTGICYCICFVLVIRSCLVLWSCS